MPVPTTQKQWRLAEQTGIDALHLVEDAPTPKIHSPKGVLVKINAVSLNYRDLLISDGRYPMPIPKDVITCSDASGEVIEVGPDVTKFKVGDKVLGQFNQGHVSGRLDNESIQTGLGGSIPGVLQQYRVFAEHGLVHKPAHLTQEEGACLPCAAVTSWNALYSEVTDTKIHAGQTILLQGTGGVSIFALQFAAAAGLKVIITSSSDEKREKAKQIWKEAGGAPDAISTINYKEHPDWDEEAMKLTSKQGVDLVVEVGGIGTFEKSLKAIRLGGSVHLIGFLAQLPKDAPAPNIPMLAFVKEAITRGLYVGSRHQFEAMNNAIEAHKLRPVVDKVFPFTEAKEAYKYLASQKHIGKVVIKVD